MKKILSLIILIGAASVTMAQNVKQDINNTKVMKKFELPALPYAADALAPTISEQTINYHYGKHLQTYINNLNALIVGTEFENADLIDIVKRSDGAIFNNAAQALNHEFYFNTFSATPQAAPSGKLLAAIEKQWGSLDNFKKEFVAAGVAIFGSGWVWLASDKDGTLSIVKCANGDNPLTKGLTPLLGADVWEHAYYLDYQNRRADHLAELWKITDWKAVQARY